MLYDGLGNRISRIEYEIEEGKVSEKKTVEYINDLSSPITQVLAATDEKGKTDTFIYGLQRIAKVNDKSKADYYLYDGLGSVTGLTNAKGALVGRYSYDEFGIPTASSKFGQGGERSNTYGYTGEDFDQTTGLLYLRARYYSPETGRFINQDPLPGNLIAPRTQNSYAYVLNNPLSYVDRTGLGPKVGTGVTLSLSNIWPLDVGVGTLTAMIRGTAHFTGEYLNVDLGPSSITLTTPLANYTINKLGTFSAAPNTNGWSATGWVLPGIWFHEYYVDVFRKVSYDQGPLKVSYTAEFLYTLKGPGPGTGAVAALGAVAIAALAVTLGPEATGVVAPVLKYIVQ